MKHLLLTLALILVSGCSNLTDMNTNMHNTNTLLVENTKTMSATTAAIENNSAEVNSSTHTMRCFLYIFPVLLLLVFLMAPLLFFKYYRKPFIRKFLKNK